ncbi:MAG: thioredoxin family protein [Gemmataceae bacterium]|nr:thioredoxin family protein [Gemmataceae bacterium]
MNPTRTAGLLRLLIALPMALCPAPGRAAGLKWQPDYATAVKESAKTGKPLLVVVGTEACFWCKQLDAKSLAAEEVAELLNGRYLLYKLDAGKEEELAKALKAQVYPSLYFASSTGQIVAYQEGFLEPDKLKEKLVTVLAAVGTPDWMARDFELAEASAKAGKPYKALALLRGVTEDGKSRPVQAKARELMARLEKEASAEAEKAREMADNGKTVEAIKVLRTLGDSYPGTLAAREGKTLMLKLMSRNEEAERERASQAKDLLDAARKELRARQFLPSLEKCEQLASAYPETAEGGEASKMVEEIKGNPEWVKEMVGVLGERQGMLYLALADTLARRGEPAQAIHYLERVLVMFPDTKHAEAAKSKLARLKGSPR